MDIIRLTAMKRPEASKPSRAVDAKAEALRRQGALHPHPDTVRDEAFHQGEFFDPQTRRSSPSPTGFANRDSQDLVLSRIRVELAMKDVHQVLTQKEMDIVRVDILKRRPAN